MKALIILLFNLEGLTRLTHSPSVKLPRVLLNLFNNSFDAIEIKWIKIRPAINHDILMMRVTDSGEGISPEVVQNIMQSSISLNSKIKARAS